MTDQPYVHLEDPEPSRQHVAEEPPEDSHLEVLPYDDSERVEPPAGYDDTINVGDVANAEAEQR